MKKGIRVVLTVLVLAAASGGGHWIYQVKSSTAKATATASGTFTQIVEVTKGTLDATVSVVGQLEAKQR